MATTKKQKTLLQTWREDVPPLVRVGAYAFIGWRIYKTITAEIERQRQIKLQNQATNPVYNLPGGTTTLPSGYETTTGTFNAAQKAQTFYYHFNPDGWTSDEKGMLDTIMTIPAVQFKNVAAYYAQAYPGRDMMADADSELMGSIWAPAWLQYKTQIPIQ